MKKRKKMPRAADRRGFTLLELLISLTITSVIIILVLAALRLGFRAWEKGEKSVADQQRYRLVLDRVKHQISSSATSLAADQDGEPRLLFSGDTEKMRFVSRLPLIPGSGGGMVVVHYALMTGKDGTRQFMMAEKNLVLAGPDAEFEPPPDDFTVLIDQVERFQIDFLKAAEAPKQPFWQSTWYPNLEKGIPLAVRIRLTMGGQDEPVTIIAAISQEDLNDDQELR